jgi:hypothetical protein
VAGRSSYLLGAQLLRLTSDSLFGLSFARAASLSARWACAPGSASGSSPLAPRHRLDQRRNQASFDRSGDLHPASPPQTRSRSHQRPGPTAPPANGLPAQSQPRQSGFPRQRHALRLRPRRRRSALAGGTMQLIGMNIVPPRDLADDCAWRLAFLDDPRLLNRRPAPAPLRTRKDCHRHRVCPSTPKLVCPTPLPRSSCRFRKRV